MKKNLKLFLLVGLVASVGLTSCSKDEETTVTPTPTDAGITAYSDKIYGDQANNSAGSFFATSTGTVYTQALAKTNAASVDFLYYYGATNKATLAAPNDAPAATIYDNATNGLQTWSVKNATEIRETMLTADIFNAVAADSTLTQLYDAAAIGAAATSATDLAVGDVVAFKTVGNKKGFIKVVAIVENGTTATGDYIKVDVKVQK